MRLLLTVCSLGRTRGIHTYMKLIPRGHVRVCVNSDVIWLSLRMFVRLFSYLCKNTVPVGTECVYKLPIMIMPYHVCIHC